MKKPEILESLPLLLSLAIFFLLQLIDPEFALRGQKYIWNLMIVSIIGAITSFVVLNQPVDFKSYQKFRLKLGMTLWILVLVSVVFKIKY